MERSYEVIIIGSGLSGLASAYILSKNGFKVALFEKHSQFGGCLQSFTREGVKFETGMHYIGSMGEGEILNRYFKYLSIAGNIDISPLDRSGYDVIDFRDERYSYANGRENFIETLSARFPKRREDIRKYIQTINQVTRSSPYYSFQNFDTLGILNPDHVTKSVNEFIDEITEDDTLRNVLVGNLPLYAGVRNMTPLYVHALISDFYISSAYRVVNGSDSIATSLVNSIKEMGGKLFKNAEIKKIICDDTHATAVELANGERVETKYIISSIHPEALLPMLDTHLIRRAYRDRICSMPQTVSTFTVFIKFAEGKIPYLNYNYFKYRGKSVWGCEDYTQENWPLSYLYMHQCSSKEQQWARGAILFAYMNYSEVQQWNGTGILRRGEDYEAFKRMKAERLLAALEADFPGTICNIENYWTSTPLTYQDYTATKEGSTYGVLRDMSKPLQSVISQKTKVPNLYLTGQNTNSHGVLGVIIGAIITCSELLGREFLINQICEI